MARPANEDADPVDVHLLGAEAIVNVSDALAQLVQNPDGLQNRGVRIIGIFMIGCISSILSYKPACKPLIGGTDDKLVAQRPTYRADFAQSIILCAFSAMGINDGSQVYVLEN
jgi:hypothetical protein